jgi:hypothetical protein
MMKDLSPQAWNARYEEENTPWDLQGPTPEFQRLLKANIFKVGANVLVPGGGRGYDAIELAKSGRVPYLVDFAPAPIQSALEKATAERVTVYAYQKDFFQLLEDSFHRGFYDGILEYTFYCAIDPKRREEYAKLAAELLRPNGTFVGLFFPTEMDREGPPFVVSEDDVRAAFSPYFEISFQKPEQSITPRKGREFLGIFKKKRA